MAQLHQSTRFHCHIVDKEFHLYRLHHLQRIMSQSAPSTNHDTHKIQNETPAPSEDFALISTRELFTFSPFGLGCRRCKNCASIQLDERCILRHLSKHGTRRSVTTVRLLLDDFRTQIEKSKYLHTIEQYRVDNNVYKGFSCICGQVFQLRKDSAIRLCQKLGCDASKLQKIDLFKLCCGSYVSQAQIDSLFAPPHITKQFNYAEARAVLISFLP